MANESNSMGYGYVDDEEGLSKQANFGFGLTQKNVFITKFEYIMNGGKDGAEGEALDIVVNINGTEKSMRKFPVTKAFKKGTNEEVTDPRSSEMQQAFKDLNTTLTHIMHCFVAKDDLAVALGVPINGFKDYCRILVGLMPKDFATRNLDIFMQWQWQISGENNTTFLEIPKTMKHGRWLSPAVRPFAADGINTDPDGWKESRVDSPEDTNPKALRYIDAAGNEHPFFRNGWYMNSNFASQQKVDDGYSNAPAVDNSAFAPTASLPTGQGSESLPPTTAAPTSPSAW